MSVTLRSMQQGDWREVAGLIHSSTNAWYVTNGRSPIFSGPTEDALIFCRVYEALDPGCCLLAIDESSEQIVGSCFYHPRPSHVSLGIMNVHPDHFGRGIASRLLGRIIEIAEESGLPTRLVSSAVNLDSFSLYSKAGFVPRLVYQDMVLTVPENGMPCEPPENMAAVRMANLNDLSAMVELERQVHGLERTKDLRYFLENQDLIWRVVVYEVNDQILGWLVAVDDPGSNMLGPGVMTDERVTNALVFDQLNALPGRSPVWLVPALCRGVVDRMYEWGARNCELHFAQCLGEWNDPVGVVMPTFMPETS